MNMIMKQTQTMHDKNNTTTPDYDFFMRFLKN